MKKLFFISLLAFSFLSAGVRKGPDTNTTAKIKAVFIYNFTKYIEWPSSYREGSFTVGIYGQDSPLYNELSKMARTKKIANQPFEIKKFESLSEVNKCHILYVPKKYHDEINKISRKIKSYSTLLVTEENKSVSKAGINFLVINNRQKFELYKSNVKKQNLKVSTNLEALAFAVK